LTVTLLGCVGESLKRNVGRYHASMNIDLLTSEADKLSRLVTCLVPDKTGDIVGIWWGAESDQHKEDVPYWLALDGAALPTLGIASKFLVVSVDHSSLSGVATVLDSAPRDSTRKGRPLYAVAARSLPPIDAVFLFGSDEVDTWLAECSWQRDWEYNDNFPDPVARHYEELFQLQHPLYTNSAWAAVGGWHLPWPDGDWRERLNDRLLVTTYRDSEPWLEVWATAHADLEVAYRIT
jgi:hypothetical protein